MNSNRPIIVVGCPRSGTTLLQLMLHAHPRIAIPPENRFVLPAYRKRWEWGDLRNPANLRRLAKWIVKFKGGKFGDFGLDPAEVVEEIVAGPPTLGSALATVFHAYARKHGKPRWGDKRPKYATSLPIVRRLFPDAQFISIVRDGRDCVASLKEMSWYKPDSFYAARTWALSIDAARKAAREMGPDSFYELQYEHLVSDPEGQLRGLCEFLREDYHATMAEPAQVADVIPERKSHHSLTHEPVTRARVGSWQDRLDPWETSLCETMLGDRLRAYGYELTGAPRSSPTSQLRYWKRAIRRSHNVPLPLVRTAELIRRQGPVAAQPLAQPATPTAPADGSRRA